MMRNTEIEASAAKAFGEIELPYMASQEDGVFRNIVWNDSYARASFDRAGSRIEIAVTKVTDFFNITRYIVSVPNCYYSGEHDNLHKVAYAMQDKTGIAKVDCESAQVAAVKMKELMDEYEQNARASVELNLIHANTHLARSLELLIEANKGEGQMDFVTHPRESDLFGQIQFKARKIDKIMYQQK